MLVFAWQHARHIDVSVGVEDHGWKVYRLYGTLFFASTADFLSKFTPAAHYHIADNNWAEPVCQAEDENLTPRIGARDYVRRVARQ